MFKKIMSVTTFVGTAFALFCGGVAQAANGTWTGADSNTYWTNSLNWSASPYPAGTQTATFSNGGNGQTTINLIGLTNIANVTFDTAGVAAYTLGSGAVGSQTLVLTNNGMCQVTASAGASQTVNASVQLGTDRTAGSYFFHNDSSNKTLTVAGTLFSGTTSGTAGTKTLSADGAGSIVFSGSISNGTASAIILTNGCAGTLTLSGSNTITTLYITGTSNTVTDIGSGYLYLNNSGSVTLYSTQGGVINGVGGKIKLSTNTGSNYGDNYIAAGKTLVINASLVSDGGFEMWSGTGTFVFNGINDFASNILFGTAGTISVSKIGNQGSTTSNFGRGQRLLLNTAGCTLLYTGVGETSDRILELNQSATIDHSGSGTLTFSTAPAVGANVKTLTLQGSAAGVGEIAGAIGPGTGTTSLTKAGAGTWRLFGANTYAGATLVNGGTLSLAGTLGATTATSGFTITNGATLLLSNMAGNNTNRLSDTAPIALNGGTLSFANAGGATNYGENAGALAVNLNANTIATSQADAGQAATLRFASLSRTPVATVNFTGTGIGDSDRNRIFIAGQSNGLFGAWATINGTSLAAYDSVKGVYAADTALTGIAARGPFSVIPDNAASGALINSTGTSGPITLAGAWTNSTLLVQQSTATDAIVALRDGATNKTLLTSGLLIGAGMASLTVGESFGDGSLAALTPGGTLSLQNNETSTVLTVNAPVVNNTSASALSKYGPGKVLLTASNSYSGITLINDGPLVFGGSSTQALTGVVSGAGELVKSGSGRLLLQGINTYTGPTTIKEGVLMVYTNNALGSTVTGTVIEAGATLDLGGNAGANGLILGAEQITVSGAGVNGRGAIINSSNVSQYNAMRFLTLAGDTTFGGELANGRWDVRNTATPATLTMNDFTITKVGSNYVGLTSVNVTPGAGNIDVKEGWFTTEGGTTMGGSAANVLTVRGGAAYDIYALTTPIAWSLVMSDNAKFYSRSGNVTSQNIWAGPVTLNGRATFDGVSSTLDTLSGSIAGSGFVVKTGTGSSTYFTSSNNTYNGTTTISNGLLYAKYPGSLPGYDSGKLTVLGGGSVIVASGDGTTGWSYGQIKSLYDATPFATNTAVLGIDTALGSVNFADSLTKPMALIKQGNNTLTLAGTNTFTGALTVSGGQLVMSGGGNHVIGALTIGSASVLLTNATAMSVYAGSNNVANVGYNGTDIGSLTLAGNASWSSFLTPYNLTGGSAALNVGNSGKGTLVVKDTASITNKIMAGIGAGSAGAIYQRGGFVQNWGGAANDSRLGINGYGYYELSAGTLTNMGYTQIGHTGAGIGILAQTGGTLLQGAVFGGSLAISRGGTGVVYLAGGTFATSAGVVLGEASDNNLIRGYAELTLAANSSASATINGNVSMADRTNMFSTLNLNGGTLAAYQISKSSSRTGSVALVNFNGGTLLARAAGNVNLFNTGANAPDAVNIFAGGARIDTTNLPATISVPLLAPAVSGVSGITVTPRGGYMGPPFVTISGGGGTGATAFAQFDSVSNTVSGIIVTCPGFGYTNAPTVTLSGGGTNIQTAVTGVTLTANVSGGLTKLGTGMLTLSATNTYGGTTTVSNGVLRLGVAGALPASGSVSVAGGTLDLGGLSITNGNVTVSSGAIVNGTLTSGSLAKGSSGTFTLGVPFAASAPIVVGGGTLKLSSAQPGLYEGMVYGSFSTSSNNPNTSVQLSTRMANTTLGWSFTNTCIYSGYIWNRASTNVTWTFAENFDDSVYLQIDSTILMTNGISWNVPTISTITLSPGAHSFSAFFGQGLGGAGPNIAGWWTSTTLGFGYDPLGRNSTNIVNYQALTDPGDGSLLTLTSAGSTSTNLISTAATVEMAAGSVLDLAGLYQSLSGLSGSGTVSNGTLAVTGTIAPGGTNVIGTLTVAAPTELTGTLLVDVAADGTSDRLAVQGNVNLASLALTIANPDQLDRRKQYTILTCTGTRTGTFSSTNLPSSRWRVISLSDGTVKLVFLDGALLKLL